MFIIPQLSKLIILSSPFKKSSIFIFHFPFPYMAKENIFWHLLAYFQRMINAELYHQRKCVWHKTAGKYEVFWQSLNDIECCTQLFYRLKINDIGNGTDTIRICVSISLTMWLSSAEILLVIALIQSASDLLSSHTTTPVEAEFTPTTSKALVLLMIETAIMP